MPATCRHQEVCVTGQKVGEAAAPHYLGHRERLRERFRLGGFTAAQDYELLELALFRSSLRGDVKPKAKALLARFGSLAAVLSASLPELMSVDRRRRCGCAGPQAGARVAQRIGREPAAKRTVISSWSALLSYVRVALQHEGREQVRVLYLDRKNQLIMDEVSNHGTVDHAPIYPREIVRRALELSASSVILVHNHPRVIRPRPRRISRLPRRSSPRVGRWACPCTTIWWSAAMGW